MYMYAFSEIHECDTAPVLSNYVQASNTHVLELLTIYTSYKQQWAIPKYMLAISTKTLEEWREGFGKGMLFLEDLLLTKSLIFVDFCKTVCRL